MPATFNQHMTPLPFLLISAAFPPLSQNPLTSPSLGPAAYNARCPTQGPNGCLGAREVAYETKRIHSASRLYDFFIPTYVVQKKNRNNSPIRKLKMHGYFYFAARNYNYLTLA
jgi:hypothetical protein